MSGAAERMPEELRVLVEREVGELMWPRWKPGLRYRRPTRTIVGPVTLHTESGDRLEVELWPVPGEWADRYGEVWVKGYDGAWRKGAPIAPTIRSCAAALRKAWRAAAMQRSANALLCEGAPGSLWAHMEREISGQEPPAVTPEDLQWVVRAAGFGAAPEVVDMLAARMIQGATRVETAADGARRCVHLGEVERG